jgi:hypothetical protein
MASFFTNRGKYRILSMVLNNGTEPTNYYAYLIDAGTPTVDTNTWSDVSANESSNYTEITLTPNATDFPTLTEDDTGDKGTVDIKDLVYTASGGQLDATWCIITDDNGTEANRDVMFCLDLGGTKSVSDTQTLTITGTTLELA